VIIECATASLATTLPRHTIENLGSLSLHRSWSNRAQVIRSGHHTGGAPIGRVGLPYTRLAPYQILLCDLNAIFVLGAFRRAESDAGINNLIFENNSVPAPSKVFKLITFVKNNIFKNVNLLYLIWSLCII